MCQLATNCSLSVHAILCSDSGVSLLWQYLSNPSSFHALQCTHTFKHPSCFFCPVLPFSPPLLPFTFVSLHSPLSLFPSIFSSPSSPIFTTTFSPFSPPLSLLPLDTWLHSVGDCPPCCSRRWSWRYCWATAGGKHWPRPARGGNVTWTTPNMNYHSPYIYCKEHLHHHEEHCNQCVLHDDACPIRRLCLLERKNVIMLVINFKCPYCW